MCQAYEAEYNCIVLQEASARKQGYIAHMEGKNVTDNPYPGPYHKHNYSYVAWLSGWEARAENLVPYSLVREYREHRPSKCWWSYEATVEEVDAWLKSQSM